MKYPTFLVIALLLAANFASAAHSQDIKGSSDHPLFPNRMPGYNISNYQKQDFAQYKFRTRPPTPVEVIYTRIHYYLKNKDQHPGGLAIRRNYENAIKSVGGKVIYSDDNVSVMKATRDGKEVWAEVQAGLQYTGRYYFMHIVECEPMKQVISADAIGSAIDKDGFIALDIHFAVGKADIEADSVPLVNEIALMLKKRPDLRVGIEGHTDSTGTPQGNKALSTTRAKAVVDALTKAGVSANRLTSAGFGQERPIADNRTEEGRAKNRRVEVVRK